jgi:very-short-patch-repair endonuclease
MLTYKARLKPNASQLRKKMTDSERALWLRLRGKQLLGVQFYRQKPIGNFIVDFYAPKARLVVEVDGSQHMEGDQAEKDWNRDVYLRQVGLEVLRFNSREVLKETDAVVEAIYQTMARKLKVQRMPGPQKG